MKALNSSLFNFDSFRCKFLDELGTTNSERIIQDLLPRRLSKWNQTLEIKTERTHGFHTVYLSYGLLEKLTLLNDELCFLGRMGSEDVELPVRILPFEEKERILTGTYSLCIYLDDLTYDSLGLSIRQRNLVCLRSCPLKTLVRNFGTSYETLGLPIAKSIKIALLNQPLCIGFQMSMLKAFLEMNTPFVIQEGQFLSTPIYEILYQLYTDAKHTDIFSEKVTKRPKLQLPKSIKLYSSGARNSSLLYRIFDVNNDQRGYFSSTRLSIYLPHKTEIKIIEKPIPNYLPRLLSEYQQRAGIPLSLLPLVIKLLKNQSDSWPKIKQILKKIRGDPNASDAVVFMSGAKGIGKSFQVGYLANSMGYNFIEKNSKSIFSIQKFERIIEKASQMRPAVLYLRNCSSLKTIFAAFQRSQGPVSEQESAQMLLSAIQKSQKQYSSPFPLIVVFSSNATDLKDPWVKALNDISSHMVRSEKFTKEMNMALIQGLSNSKFTPTETEEIENAIRGMGWKKALHFLISLKIEQKTLKEIIKELEQFSKANGMNAASLNIPNVTWNDVGGLKEAKHEITDMIMLPQMYPELFASKIRPRTGLLFYGPPGTGKTLLAKAIANECKMNFISVKGPELLNMYVGESEKNIRDIFDLARNNLPCIIFFDELDALVPNRGKGSDSNQVMDRMVAQFLTEIDGLGKKHGLFVIGATNRPDLLDPSLLTPGRFDKLIYLGINEEKDSRIKILQAQTRKFNLDKDVDFDKIEELTPKNFTGADFYALTSQSMLKSIKRNIAKVEEGFAKAKEKDSSLSFFDWSKGLENSDEQVKIVVCQEDFESTLKEIKPSVIEKELEKYKQIQKQFSG